MLNKFKPRYDAALIRQDAGALGWDDSELAKRCRKNVGTISLFLGDGRQTPKTAKAIARALKQPVDRYLLPIEGHQRDVSRDAVAPGAGR